VASTSTLNVSRASRASAWHDPADANLKVSLTEYKQRRKLRRTAEEDQLDGTRYEANLRDYYTKINPAPQWAVDAKNKVLHRKTKRRRNSSGSTDADPKDFVETILGTSSGELLDLKIGQKRLNSGVLSIERLRDANHSSRSQGSLHSLEFHPNPNVPVLFTAAGDRRLRLFNVSLLGFLLHNLA
jgi:U3 small nucleolar RNA-associated protein 18